MTLLRSPLVRTAATTAAVLAALAGGAWAADAKQATAKPADAKKADPKKPAPRWAQMDYGPFLTASVISDPRAKFDNGPGSFSGDSTARGVLIQLSDDWRDGVVFDMDLMRVSAGWVDGSLKLSGLIADGAHGPGPTVGVPPLFQTPHLPGWAGADGSFADPRPNTIDPLPPPGPLPRNVAHYRGLYRHGRQVVLSYTVAGVGVLDLPSVERADKATAIVRTIRLDPSDKPMTLMVADGDPVYPFPTAKKPDPIKDAKTGEVSVAADGKSATVAAARVAVAGVPSGAALVADGTQLVLRLPAVATPTTFKLYVGTGDEAAFSGLVAASAQPVDLVALTKGGPSLWGQTVTTKGKVSADKDQPYVVDSLTLPNDNPYKAWIRPGGMDFFPDGKQAALSTWSGDVWVVSGIDETLEHLVWKRVATGLHQPLGLKVVGDQIFTVGHDQITRLVDLDGDGEADFYENFNNAWELTTAFHAFCFDLQTDKDGNLYFAFGSPVHAGGGGFQKITNHHGTILRVSPDGQKLDVVATGLRAPNGIGLNAETGQLTSGDNQGTWVPVCPIHWIKPGSFLGVVDSAHKPMKSTDKKPDPAEEPKPLAWLPYPKVDNSGGGQVWVTSDRWGPFAGDLLHTSYGTSSLWKVMYEEVDGGPAAAEATLVQGGVAKLPVKFTSSAMRPRFNPADGQLYVVGLKGWQSNAAGDGGFDRVRYTGAPVRMPTALHVTADGVAITFTCPLDPATANDPENYGVEASNVRWSGAYGSGEFKPSAPDQKGKETWEVKSAKLSADGKTVVLQVAGIKPVMLMAIDYNIASADKKPLKDTVYNTVHRLGKPAATAAK
jgi:glucose/arabinose dehydrogenase